MTYIKIVKHNMGHDIMVYGEPECIWPIAHLTKEKLVDILCGIQGNEDISEENRDRLESHVIAWWNATQILD